MKPIDAGQRNPTSSMSRTEAVLLQVQHATLEELMARLGQTAVVVRHTLRGLIREHRAHRVQLSPTVQAFAWGPEPRETVATVRQHHTRTVYVPPQWSNEIARPGGEAHKQWGSLQADGTVKPYIRPKHDCVAAQQAHVKQGRG